MEKVNVTYKLFVDPENLPEDFDEQIVNAFKEYTRGNSHEFTYCDQLAFIDNFIEYMSNSSDVYDRVDQILEERILYEWRNNHELIDEHDLYSDEEMEEMYKAGKEDASLYKNYATLSMKEKKAIRLMILRVVKIVSKFKWEDE